MPSANSPQNLDPVSHICARLLQALQARAIFLVDKSGQHIVSVGDTEPLDTTALASLAAGCVATTHGLAQLIGEQEFPCITHEGQSEHLFMSVFARWAILLILFDARSTLGMVRLQTKQVRPELEAALLALRANNQSAFASNPLADITAQEVDGLFGGF